MAKCKPTPMRSWVSFWAGFLHGFPDWFQVLNGFPWGFAHRSSFLRISLGHPREVVFSKGSNAGWPRGFLTQSPKVSSSR